MIGHPGGVIGHPNGVIGHPGGLMRGSYMYAYIWLNCTYTGRFTQSCDSRLPILLQLLIYVGLDMKVTCTIY